MERESKDSIDRAQNWLPPGPIHSFRGFPFGVYTHYHANPDRYRGGSGNQPGETLRLWSPLQSLAVSIGVLLLLICIVWIVPLLRGEAREENIEASIILTATGGLAGAGSIANPVKSSIAINGTCSLSEQNCLESHCLFVPPAKGDLFRGLNRIPRICFEPVQIEATGAALVSGVDN